MKDDKTVSLIHDYDLQQPSVLLLYRILYAIGLFASIVSFAPLIWLFLSGFKELSEFVNETTLLPKTYQLEKYAETWKMLGFGRYYINSLFSVSGSVVSAVFFNGLLGYALSKIKPAGSKIIYGLVMWSLLIPATTSIVPLFVNLVRLRLVGSFIPLWLAIGANAFFVVLFKNFFDELPESLIEAAKIDGAKDFTVFMRIAVPLSKAIIMVIVLYAINAAWSDFLLPFLLLRGTDLETVMVRLYLFRGSRTSEIQILRAIFFSIIPPLVLFTIFQKQITGMALQSGIKG